MVETWSPPKDFVKGSDVFPFNDPWDGRMLFTGPSGLGDYRSHLLKDSRPVGTNQYSRELTTDSSYLWRPAPGTPFQKPRASFAGEVGYYAFDPPDRTNTRTGHQIYASEFWRQVEDVNTHRFQTPWYWHYSLGARPGHTERDRPYGPTGYIVPHVACTSSSSRPASYMAPRGLAWQRSPAATPTTLYQNEESDFSSVGSREDWRALQKQRLTARFDPNVQTQKAPQDRQRTSSQLEDLQGPSQEEGTASTEDIPTSDQTNNYPRPYTAPAPSGVSDSRSVQSGRSSTGSYSTNRSRITPPAQSSYNNNNNNNNNNGNTNGSRRFTPTESAHSGGGGSGRQSRASRTRLVDPTGLRWEID